MDMVADGSLNESQLCLTSDELFNSFMEIALTQETNESHDTVLIASQCEDKEDVKVCEDVDNEEATNSGHDTRCQANGSVSSSDENEQQCKTQLRDNNEENTKIDNVALSEQKDLDQKLSEAFVSAPQSVHKLDAIGDEINTTTCRPSERGEEVEIPNENKAALPLKSGDQDYDEKVTDLSLNSNNTEQVNEQSTKMDITVNGVTFLWNPSEGLQEEPEINEAKEIATEESTELLPDVVCNCQDTIATDGSVDTNIDTQSFENNGKTNTDGPFSGTKNAVIRDYVSQHQSAVYDSIDLRKCREVIDERLKTSSETCGLNPENDKNSKFYCDVDLNYAPSDSLKRNQNLRYEPSREEVVNDTSATSPASTPKSSDSEDETFVCNGKALVKNRPLRVSTTSEKEFKANYSFRKLRSHSDPVGVLYSGNLIKLGGSGMTPKNWRKRWFELKADNCLYYYKTEKDKVPSGAIVLANYLATRSLDTGRKYCFKITKGGARTYCFAAASEEEMKCWMKVLSEAAKSSRDTLSHIPECSVKNVSIPALSIKNPECHGYLWKQGFTHKSWKRRYCVLKSGCLYYYGDMSEAVAIGMFKLHDYDVNGTESTGRKWSIVAVPPDPRMRTFYFSTENDLEFQRWYQAFRTSIESVRTSQ